MCLRSVTETETKPESNKPEPNQTRVPDTDRQEKTDQQIRITPQPVMWKPDRVSAILPDFSSDFSESLRENTEPEKDQLSLSQKDMMIKPDINIGHENSIEGISKLLDETNTEVKNLKTDFDQNKSKFDEEKSALANAVNMAKMEKKYPIINDLRNETKPDSITSEKKKGKCGDKPYQINVKNILSFGDDNVQNVDIRPRREMKSKPDAAILPDSASLPDNTEPELPPDSQKEEQLLQNRNDVFGATNQLLGQQPNLPDQVQHESELKSTIVTSDVIRSGDLSHVVDSICQPKTDNSAEESGDERQDPFVIFEMKNEATLKSSSSQQKQSGCDDQGLMQQECEERLAPPPISKGADKVEDEKSSPSISRENEHSGKQVDKKKKKQTIFSIYLKKIRKKY
jgi:hypothetical protein